MTTESDLKWCPKCDRLQPRSHFWKNSARPDGLQDECKDCLKRYNAERRRERPEEPWLADVKHRYGLTELDVSLILRVQGNACGGCQGPFSGTGYAHFHVDHDHATGRVRGFLCQSCNVTLEEGRPVPALLARYIVDPPAKRAGVMAIARPRA